MIKFCYCHTKIFLLLVMLLLFINIIIFKRELKKYNYPSYFKELEEELDDIQNYIDMTLNGTLIDKGHFFSSNNPKISIIITVFNGEAYLKTSLLSIQNQDFKDIEIVIIDDCSLDNSLKIIKELMNKDSRIVLS